jgi:DNA-binding GntR family transcriptional regulator
MKTNTVFKLAYNRGLSRLEALPVSSKVGSEPAWSHALAVSRTTVRSVFAKFSAAGLIADDAGRRVVLRHPAPADFYPEIETHKAGAVVERRFMYWILQEDCRPGRSINVLELSRRFGASPSAVTHYLNRLRQSGLLERNSGGDWVLRGFTEEFAEELCEVRAMFELRSALRFVTLSAADPAWEELSRIKQDHLALLVEAEARYTEFSALDERLHRCVNDASRNRFIKGFYDMISMIFHYHYQWNKKDEKERNIAAIHEHLCYIGALQNRAGSAITATCNAHMATARSTLLASIRRSADALRMPACS